MSGIRVSGVLLVLGAALLQGCGTIGKTYMEINPEAAKEEVRKAEGYYALKKFKEEQNPRSLSVFRYTPWHSSTHNMCEGEKCIKGQYERMGSTVDYSDGYLLPSVAKLIRYTSLTSRKTFIAKEVEAGTFLMFKVSGSSYGNSSSYQTCGPVYATLIPQAGNAYVVQYELKNSRCRVLLYDANDPDNLIELSGNR